MLSKTIRFLDNPMQIVFFYHGFRELKISYNLAGAEKADLRIYDFFGNKVEKRLIKNIIPYQNKSEIINMQNNSSGIYFIQFQSGLKVAFDKFLILK